MSKKLDYLVWGNPQLAAKNKKVTVDGSSFKESYSQQSLPSLQENMLKYKVPALFAWYPGTNIMYWLLDEPSEVQKAVSGERGIAFFDQPRPGARMFSGRAPIDSIFKKGKDSKNIVAGVLISVQENLIEILMMAVKPGFRKNKVNSYMIDRIKSEYPDKEIKYWEPTVEGQKFVDKYTKQNPSVKTSIILRDYKFLADAVIEMVKRNEGVDIDIPAAFALIGMSDYYPDVISAIIPKSVAGDEITPRLHQIYAPAYRTFRPFFTVIDNLSKYLNRMQMDWVAKIAKKAIMVGLKDVQSRLMIEKDEYKDPKKVLEKVIQLGADFRPENLELALIYRDYNDLTNYSIEIIHAFQIAKLNEFQPILQYSFSGKTTAEAVNELRALEKQMATLTGSEFGNPMDAEDAGEPVVKFPDGIAWYRIKESYSTATAEALGHCGNEHHPGDYDEVWNLGKKMKDGRVRPAITFIVTFPYGENKGGIIGEMKGKANSIPGENYHKYIYGLFESPFIGYILGGGYGPEGNFHPERHFKGEYKEKWKQLLEKKPYLRSAYKYKEAFGKAYYEVLLETAQDDWSHYNKPRGRYYSDPHGWDSIATHLDEKITTFFRDYKPWNRRRDQIENPVIAYINLLEEEDAEEQDEFFVTLFGPIPKFKWSDFGAAVKATKNGGIRDLIIERLSACYDSGMLNAREKSLIHKAISAIKNDSWSDLDGLSLQSPTDRYSIADYLPDDMMDSFKRSVLSGYIDGTREHLAEAVYDYCGSVFDNLPGKVDWDTAFPIYGQDGGSGHIKWDTSETGEANCSDELKGDDVDAYAFEQERFQGPNHDDCYSPVDVSEYDHDYEFMSRISLAFYPDKAAEYLKNLNLESLKDTHVQKRFL